MVLHFFFLLYLSVREVFFYIFISIGSNVDILFICVFVPKRKKFTVHYGLLN